MNINEGGNVFKDETGQPLTQRINQADVMPTVQWLERLTGLDFTREKNPEDGLPARWLGSTGRKPTSGDLDLQVDSGEISKEQLVAKLQAWAAQNQVQPEKYIRKSGVSVHFFTAINGDPRRGFVQTDFMFTHKPRWNQFVLQSDPTSAFKGASRNILINSMAKSLGYKLNQNDGIADRVTNKIITDDPDRVAPLLLHPGATVRDLYSVERIMAALKNDPRREQKLADFRDHMQRAGTPLDENVAIYTEYNEVSFMARLRDRIVNQGMQPLVERTLMEDRNPRIPYIEDLVFQKGVTGAKEALAIMADTAKNTSKYATQKWDGCVHPDTKVLTSQGIMRIEDLIDHVNQSQSLTVLAHNFALSADEQVNVSDAIKKYGIKEWVEIVFESGETIKLTKDHPVFTNNRGWVLAEDLTNDDDVKHVKCD